MTAANLLAQQISDLMPEPGFIATDVPGLSLFRSDEPTQQRVPIMYDPCIYVVVQGRKSAFLGEKEFIYDALNYLVLSVALPLECKVIEASKEQPYLAAKIDINTQLLSELIYEAESSTIAPSSDVKPGIFVSKLDDGIRSTFGRLLSYVNQPSSAKVLGNLAIKELLFHVLMGAQGDLLKAFAFRDRHNYQIANVINFIQKNYAENIEVSELASKANMSQSSFHSYFKSVTNSSPIQYIKSIRLHAARRNMLYDNRTASDAAYDVGYASPSQFSREYRRFFGVSPSVDRQTAVGS